MLKAHVQWCLIHLNSSNSSSSSMAEFPHALMWEVAELTVLLMLMLIGGLVKLFLPLAIFFFCQLLLCNFVQDETIVSILNDNTFYAWKRRSIDGSCEFLSSVTPKSFDQIPVILSESKPLPYHVINKPWWLFHFIWSFVIPFFAVDLDHDHGCLHGLLSYVTLL